MSDRTTRLHRVMDDYDLTSGDVARILRVSVSTVYNWRSRGSADIIPSHKLELLELRLHLADAEARA